jgi:aconitate hydratase
MRHSAQPAMNENWFYRVAMVVPPAEESEHVELEKGPNIQSLPPFHPFPDTVEGPVLLKVEDDISTDEIMPAGEQVLPYRSNIPEISKFVFTRVDETFYHRAMQHLLSGCLVVGGRNYG